ncbi:hypothetical protein ACA910_003872 [Epithemia clementina (nom. ined.)]
MPDVEEPTKDDATVATKPVSSRNVEQPLKQKWPSKRWVLLLSCLLVLIVVVAVPTVVVLVVRNKDDTSIAPLQATNQSTIDEGGLDAESLPQQDSEETKTRWPELVGQVTGEDAKEIIRKENTSMTEVVILLEGSDVTRDYKDYRVRIFVDADGMVAETPRVG